jgi:hypothetical protein
VSATPPSEAAHGQKAVDDAHVEAGAFSATADHQNDRAASDGSRSALHFLGAGGHRSISNQANSGASSLGKEQLVDKRDFQSSHALPAGARTRVSLPDQEESIPSATKFRSDRAAAGEHRVSATPPSEAAHGQKAVDDMHVEAGTSSATADHQNDRAASDGSQSTLHFLGAGGHRSVSNQVNSGASSLGKEQLVDKEDFQNSHALPAGARTRVSVPDQEKSISSATTFQSDRAAAGEHRVSATPPSVVAHGQKAVDDHTRSRAGMEKSGFTVPASKGSSGLAPAEKPSAALMAEAKIAFKERSVVEGVVCKVQRCDGGHCDQEGCVEPACDGGHCVQANTFKPSCEGGHCDQRRSQFPSCTGGDCMHE